MIFADYYYLMLLDFYHIFGTSVVDKMDFKMTHLFLDL